MAVLLIQNTGLDHLYPNGVPINEIQIGIEDIYKLAARLSSLTVLADPYFQKIPLAAKAFSELHGEGDRITSDLLEKAARDILPVFSPFQRWLMMPDSVETFEYNGKAESIYLAFYLSSFLGGNVSHITYRWLNLDTRGESPFNYTNDMYQEIMIDANNINHIKKYLIDALVDFLLKELYRVIGYDKKYIDYNRSYEQNRQYVAYWLKNDRSTKTQYRHAGV